MKKLLLGGAIVAIVASLFGVPAAPAHADEGCVTYREANTTLESEIQSKREIERGFDATPVWKERHRGSLWAEYQPCKRPNEDQTYVHVIYFRTAEGQWKSIFWVWSLYKPFWARTVGDEWSGMINH